MASQQRSDGPAANPPRAVGCYAATLEDGSAPSPIQPMVSHPGDTHNFDHYAEDHSAPTAIAPHEALAFSEF